MTQGDPVSVVGIVSLDVTWNPEGESKMRLGGIVHACRGLWALDVPYRAFYFAPDYLVPEIENYLRAFKAETVARIGTVTGGPAVMLIGSPQETASQKYEFLMRDTVRAELMADGLRLLAQQADRDCVVIAGEFDVARVVEALSDGGGRHIHVDLANLESSKLLPPVETVITSTSCAWFANDYSANPSALGKAIVPATASRLILKENRGGSRLYDGCDWKHVGAQVRPIAHSVGVGDCFDVAFAAFYNSRGSHEAMNLASHVAAEYAATTDPDVFLEGVQRLRASDVRTLPIGVVCPWEERANFAIYVAAPDFDYLNTDHIDALCQSLTYHNFRPHRPVRENGQVRPNLSPRARRELFYADLRLLEQCQCVVAVMVPSDDGTLVEIGRAAEAGKPVILYAPGRAPENLMLVESAFETATTLDGAIAAVFRAMDRWRRENGQ